VLVERDLVEVEKAGDGLLLEPLARVPLVDTARDARS